MPNIVKDVMTPTEQKRVPVLVTGTEADIILLVAQGWTESLPMLPRVVE